MAITIKSQFESSVTSLTLPVMNLPLRNPSYIGGLQRLPPHPKLGAISSLD